MLAHIAMKTSVHREQTIAKVQDWISNKIALKIFKIVNGCGGQTYVDDKRDQLRITFPNTHLSMTDPSSILGLILDKEKGWQLVEFSYERNNPAKSALKRIVNDIGYEEPNNLASCLHQAIVATDDEGSSITDTAAMIRLIVRLSVEDLKNKK